MISILKGEMFYTCANQSTSDNVLWHWQAPQPSGSFLS